MTHEQALPPPPVSPSEATGRDVEGLVVAWRWRCMEPPNAPWSITPHELDHVKAKRDGIEIEPLVPAAALTRLSGERELLVETLALLHGPLSVAALRARADSAEAALASMTIGRDSARREWDNWMRVAGKLEAALAERDRRIAAAERLVAKLDVIHADPRYQSVWAVAQLHAGPYCGPTYTDELADLRALLGGGR